MLPQEYINLNNIIMLIICILCSIYVLHYKSKRKLLMAPISNIFTVLLCIYIFCVIIYYPIVLYGDKYRYEQLFDAISIYNIQYWEKDVLWNYLALFIKSLYDNSQFYFAIIAFIYIYGYYKFSHKYIPPSYNFVFLLTTFGSMGFINYGVNTIRAGFALSILFLSLVYEKKLYKFLLIASISILFHKSMVIPVLSLYLTRYYKNTNTYLIIWLCILTLSYLGLSSFIESLQGIFENVDERVAYLSQTENELYDKAGFRFDFVLYSLMPIISGYYYLYKKNYDNPFYRHIYNTYLVINSFWLIVIRIPFTDRFAYLSWVFFPFIILYPLLTQRLFKRQYVKIILASFTVLFINFILSVINTQ